MAKLSPIQTFNSLDAVRETFRVLLPRPYEWRLLKQPIVGEINGLPESRGIAIATNGIIVAIQQNESLFFGHLDFFVEDEDESDHCEAVGNSKGRKRVERLFESFDE